MAFTVATDAPVSQAKVVESIARVEEQVATLSKRNSQLQQQLEEKLGSEGNLGTEGTDALPESQSNDTEVRYSEIHRQTCSAMTSFWIG